MNVSKCTVIQYKRLTTLNPTTHLLGFIHNRIFLSIRKKMFWKQELKLCWKQELKLGKTLKNYETAILAKKGAQHISYSYGL